MCIIRRFECVGFFCDGRKRKWVSTTWRIVNVYIIWNAMIGGREGKRWRRWRSMQQDSIVLPFDLVLRRWCGANDTNTNRRSNEEAPKRDRRPPPSLFSSLVLRCGWMLLLYGMQGCSCCFRLSRGVVFVPLLPSGSLVCAFVVYSGIPFAVQPLLSLLLDLLWRQRPPSAAPAGLPWAPPWCRWWCCRWCRYRDGVFCPPIRCLLNIDRYIPWVYPSSSLSLRFPQFLSLSLSSIHVV